MKRISLLLLSLFIIGSMHIYAQEPEVKMLANPESSRKDEIILKDGTHVFSKKAIIKEGEFVRVGRKTYNWKEIESIKLSKVSLNFYSPNYGENIPVHYDSTIMNDRVILKNGTTIDGTLYDFAQYYQLKMEKGPFSYKTSKWDNIKEVKLGKGSPFAAFSDDPTFKMDTSYKTPVEETKVKFDKNGYKFSSYQTLNTDQIRKAWQIRGGPIFCKEYYVSLSLMSAKGMSGTGLGYGGAVSYIHLTPPSYSDGISNTYAYKLGANINMQTMTAKMSGVSAKGTVSNITLGLNFGYQVGLGKFLDYKDWKGIVAGFAWRPTFQMSSSSFTIANKTYSNSDSNFNMKGYEFYVDFANLKAITSRYVKPAHMKVFAIIIPPIGDMKMTFVQIGFGMVSY